MMVLQAQHKKGWMYILECADGSYYTGSTNNLELRLAQHQEGKGANHTKKRLPVKLVYTEEFHRIDKAFQREKQVQGWSRNKKEVLIKGNSDQLPKLAMAYRDVVSSASTTKSTPSPEMPSASTTKDIPSPSPEALEGELHKGEENNPLKN